MKKFPLITIFYFLVTNFSFAATYPASCPAEAKAIVEATTHFRNAEIIAKVSEGLGEAMQGIEIEKLEVKMANRGW